MSLIHNRKSSSSFVVAYTHFNDEMRESLIGTRPPLKEIKEIKKIKKIPTKAIAKGKDKADKAMKDSEAFRTMTEHKIPIDELAQKLGTSIYNGLTEESVHNKIKIFGENRLSERKGLPWYCHFIKALTGFFSLLLWAGSFLCFVAYAMDRTDPSNLYLGLALALTVLGTGCFSYFQEAKSAAIMAGFKDMIPPKCTVIREGIRKEVESSKLVPGDIVLIKQGARIPGDIRILESNDMRVDNSSLTGESEPLLRSDICTNENPLETENLAFFGTMCSSGEGKGIIISTGDRTVIGRIAGLAVSTPTEQTTLNREIDHFVKIISCVAITLGLIFFALGFTLNYTLVINIINAIGVIVANVPEGLLAEVTVALSLTAKRMANKNVLVKNLECVETLGSATCICSDKTGTLTENKMRVVSLWYDSKTRDVNNYEDKANGALGYNIEDSTYSMLLRCAILNSKAQFNFSAPSELFVDRRGNHLSDEQIKIIKEGYKNDVISKSVQVWPTLGGDASEIALIKFFNPVQDVSEFRECYPVLVRDGIKGEIPFNSANKYAVTIHEPTNWNPPEHQGDCILFMKGAPEQLWERCSTILKDGESVPISNALKDSFTSANKQFGGKGQRVLGFAYIWLPASEFPRSYVFKPNGKNGPNFPLTGLTFIGLTALMDPPRKGVKEAVISAHEAGIKVIMVTGDQPLTATAIARQVNIITAAKTVNDLVDEGMDMDKALKLSDAIVIHGDLLTKAHIEDSELPFRKQRICKWLQKKEIVFARTSPAQKYMIVDANQKLKHIVAVTGDGVNDSPAIKKADIGIAMGIVGSDVAKDAADMLLIDDNFASIIEGVKQGRVIFDNLKRTITYVLASNIPEILPFLAFVVFQLPLPLTTILMLAIDLGTDMIPAVALAYEEPELDIMKREPRNADKDYLMTYQLLFFAYMQSGMIEAMGGFMTYFVVMHDYGFHPQTLWYFALDTSGTKPDKNDVYNPNVLSKGNTNIGKSEYDGVAVDYLTNTDGVYDLRIWFYNFGTDSWSDCRYPDLKSPITGHTICYTSEALHYAQCAWFIAIVVTQWANIMIVKTRKGSFIDVGMRNGAVNWGILFETILALLLCYVPGLNVALGGRPLPLLQWGFPALPFFLFLLFFDEVRKLLMRIENKRHPNQKGWVERNTYY